MKLKKNLFFVLIFNISANVVFGQGITKFSEKNSHENIIENIALYTDREIYISGEKIWFSAFCYINENLSNISLSNVLYIELYDQNLKSIIKKKFRISDGIAFGSIKIPEETPGGNYFIRAYTQYLRNFPPEEYFTSFITIINPKTPIYQENKTDSTKLQNLKSQINKKKIYGKHHDYKLSSESVKINLNIEKEKYSCRELVNINIKPDFDDLGSFAFLTASVVKHGTLREKDTILPEYLSKNPQLLNSYLLSSESKQDLFRSEKKLPQSILNKIINTKNIKRDSNYKDYKKFTWIAENRDVSISGIVLDKSSQKPLSNHMVFASVLGSNPQFHINSTRKNGEFIFSLNKLKNMQGVIISMKQWKDYQAEFRINNDFSGKFAHTVKIPNLIDSTQRMLLEEMFINYQITKLYGKKKTNSAQEENKLSLNIGESDISIKLDDYISLPTLKDVIREIIPYTRLSKKDDEYSLIISNSKTIEVYREPLILLDNIPVFNVNELLKISPKKIERIEVIDRTYIYGDFTLNGIIRIVTKTDNFAGYDFSGESVYVDFITISDSEIPHPQDYSVASLKNSRIPDFRNTLYWKPDLRISNNDTSLKFYTSDHCSKYDIIIRGISDDGKACFGRTSIEVVK